MDTTVANVPRHVGSSTPKKKKILPLLLMINLEFLVIYIYRVSEKGVFMNTYKVTTHFNKKRIIKIKETFVDSDLRMESN